MLVKFIETALWIHKVSYDFLQQKQIMQQGQILKEPVRTEFCCNN